MANNPIDALRKKMWDEHWTQYQLAAAIGISPAFLSEVMRGNRQPSPKILNYLGLQKEIVYRRKKPESQSVSDNADSL